MSSLSRVRVVSSAWSPAMAAADSVGGATTATNINQHHTHKQHTIIDSNTGCGRFVSIRSSAYVDPRDGESSSSRIRVGRLPARMTIDTSTGTQREHNQRKEGMESSLPAAPLISDAPAAAVKDRHAANVLERLANGSVGSATAAAAATAGHDHSNPHHRHDGCDRPESDTEEDEDGSPRPRHTKISWTPALEERLLELRAEGWTWAHIGNALNGTAVACQTRMNRIGKRTNQRKQSTGAGVRKCRQRVSASASVSPRVRARRPAGGSSSWSAADDARLLALRMEGVTYRQIAIELQRSTNACQLRHAKWNRTTNKANLNANRDQLQRPSDDEDEEDDDGGEVDVDGDDNPTDSQMTDDLQSESEIEIEGQEIKLISRKRTRTEPPAIVNGSDCNGSSDSSSSTRPNTDAAVPHKRRRVDDTSNGMPSLMVDDGGVGVADVGESVAGESDSDASMDGPYASRPAWTAADEEQIMALASQRRRVGTNRYSGPTWKEIALSLNPPRTMNEVYNRWRNRIEPTANATNIHAAATAEATEVNADEVTIVEPSSEPQSIKPSDQSESKSTSHPHRRTPASMPDANPPPASLQSGPAASLSSAAPAHPSSPPSSPSSSSSPSVPSSSTSISVSLSLADLLAKRDREADRHTRMQAEYKSELRELRARSKAQLNSNKKRVSRLKAKIESIHMEDATLGQLIEQIESYEQSCDTIDDTITTPVVPQSEPFPSPSLPPNDNRNRSTANEVINQTAHMVFDPNRRAAADSPAHNTAVDPSQTSQTHANGAVSTVSVVQGVPSGSVSIVVSSDSPTLSLAGTGVPILAPIVGHTSNQHSGLPMVEQPHPHDNHATRMNYDFSPMEMSEAQVNQVCNQHHHADDEIYE